MGVYDADKHSPLMNKIETVIFVLAVAIFVPAVVVLVYTVIMMAVPAVTVLVSAVVELVSNFDTFELIPQNKKGKVLSIQK